MKDRDFLSVINNCNFRLSKGQRAIVHFINENYDKAAFMTAGKLGKEVGVSDSTVVRFAVDLGYRGYPEMRKAMQDMVRSRLTSVQRIEVAKRTIDENNLIKSVISVDIEMLQTTLQQISHEDFNTIVDLLIKADHLYIVGMRTSTSLASFFALYMNLLRKNVHVIRDTAASEVFEQMDRIGEKDVCFGISFPRYSTKTVESMSFAKARGAHVVGLTDSPTSPICSLSSVSLYAKSEMISFLDSLAAPLSVINALIVAVGAKTGQSAYDTFKELEDIWTKWGVYEPYRK